MFNFDRDLGSGPALDRRLHFHADSGLAVIPFISATLNTGLGLHV